jgi:hypothetical protein
MRTHKEQSVGGHDECARAHELTGRRGSHVGANGQPQVVAARAHTVHDPLLHSLMARSNRSTGQVNLGTGNCVNASAGCAAAGCEACAADTCCGN